MKSKSTKFGAVCALFFLLFSGVVYAEHCSGKFANPITDICWSCIFPIKIAGSVTLASMNQEDSSNPGDTICACTKNGIPKVGLPVSFWEPVRKVDVVRDPFCLSGLGGIDMDPGLDTPEHGRTRFDNQTDNAFYQVHWYIDPIIYILEVILDNGCLEKQGFDIAYMTELDPMWSDDELTRILEPDNYLFANFPAIAACAADCVTATTGFPNNLFFWCAGCQGSLYPSNGNVQYHTGGVRSSSLVMQKLVYKMHRMGVMWAAHGKEGMCGYYPLLVMDKQAYKYQMLYPIPQTKKINGRCCQPFGRSTIDWGAGKEFPYKGEDFVYQIFRKRNCCQGAFDASSISK